MKVRVISQLLAFLFFLNNGIILHAAQIAWYVSFSGESAVPINNIYALTVEHGSLLGNVLPSGGNYKELRNMTVDSDGKLYVINAYKSDSKVMVFDQINSDGVTRNFLDNVISITTSSGLIHPYAIEFDPNSDLYVSVQDTNIILGFYGYNKPQPWQAKPIASYLQSQFPHGIFAPGTFIPAFTADIPPVTPVPPNQGGLTLDGTHSVRGFAFGPSHTLYVADEGKNRITMYDAQSGEYLGSIKDDRINRPVQMLYNNTNKLLYIGCHGNHRVLTYNPKTAEINTFINDESHLSGISGIAFGEDGKFYAADRNTRTIYKYSEKGNNPVVFSGPFTDSPESLIPIYATIKKQ